MIHLISLEEQKRRWSRAIFDVYDNETGQTLDSRILHSLVLQCMCSEMICDKAWGVTSFRETSVLSNLPSPSLEKTSVL